jgi:hypothetical protein
LVSAQFRPFDKLHYSLAERDKKKKKSGEGEARAALLLFPRFEGEAKKIKSTKYRTAYDVRAFI